MPAVPIIGQIMPFAGAMVPRGWVRCDGAKLAINQYQSLFSVIGTSYGGDGTRTFALPDLRGRAVLGASDNTGSIPVGMVSGSETVVLNASQIPSHAHFIQATIATAASDDRTNAPDGKIFCKNDSPQDNPTKVFTTTGKADRPLSQDTNIVRNVGDRPHNNMQPYLVVNYLMAIEGIYPSRS